MYIKSGHLGFCFFWSKLAISLTNNQICVQLNSIALVQTASYMIPPCWDLPSWHISNTSLYVEPTLYINIYQLMNLNISSKENMSNKIPLAGKSIASWPFTYSLKKILLGFPTQPARRKNLFLASQFFFFLSE